LLISKGADLNYVNGGGVTPAMQAVTWGGQFDIALMFLEAGADPRIYIPESNMRLVHVVAGEARREASWNSKQRADYEKLAQWLEDHGESLKEAKADRERWNSWSHTTGEYRRKIDREVAARKANENAATKGSPKKSKKGTGVN
jgi:hypothetical protein